MVEWQITFWDVGQGDATDIALPDGSHIIIDAGPPAKAGNPFPPWFLGPDAGKPRIKYLILTHTHRDHFGGAMLLCRDEHQQIDNVILPFDKNIKKLDQLRLEDPDDLKELKQFLGILWKRSRQTKVARCEKPGIIYEDSALRLSAISPSPSAKVGSVNASGLILFLDAIGSPGEPIVVWSGDTLLANIDSSPIESISGVLTGPHHGKPQDVKPKEPDEKTGYFRSVCRKLSPKVLFVSVGTKNPYDHPYRRYLVAASQAGVRVCCSELTRKCKEKCNEHVYQGSFMLGLPPPPKAIQCRGTMRVYVSAENGLRFDKCQDEFLAAVQNKVPEGYCHKKI